MNYTSSITRGDMHFHTTRSDGYQTWQERIEDAVRKKLQLITTTDHDIMSSEGFIAEARKNNIITFPSVEISTKDYEKQKSMHVTCYLRDFNQQLISVLDNTREKKQQLMSVQLERIFSLWFEWGVEDFFAYFEKKWRPRWWLNKFDIARYVYSTWSNKQRIKKLLWNDFDLQDNYKVHLSNITKFYLLCLKDNGELNSEYGVRIPEYEPEIEQIAEILKDQPHILSIAHPNFTLEKEWITYFKENIQYYLNKGINGIEINSKASPEWIDAIQWVTTQYNLYQPRWSDNHMQGEVDNKHEDYGVLNPHLSDEQNAQEFQKIIDHIEPYSIAA